MTRLGLLRAGAVCFCLACANVQNAAAAGVEFVAAPNGEQTDRAVFSRGDDGALVHRASGYSVPSALRDMPRRKIRTIAADDVMVQYTLRGGGSGDAWMDVIVYPARQTLAQELQVVQNQIVRAENAVPIDTQSPLPAGARDGGSNWYRAALGDRTMTTGYVMVQRGDWFILVRATNPDEAGAAGLKRLAAVLATVDWSGERLLPGTPRPTR